MNFFPIEEEKLARWDVKNANDWFYNGNCIFWRKFFLFHADFLLFPRTPSYGIRIVVSNTTVY